MQRPKQAWSIRGRRSMLAVLVSAAGVALAASGLEDGAAAAQLLDRSHDTTTFEQRFGTLDRAADSPGTRYVAHTPWHDDFGDAYHSWMRLFLGQQDDLFKDHLQQVASGSSSSQSDSCGVLIEVDETRFFRNRQEIWSMPASPEYEQTVSLLADPAVGGGLLSDRRASPVPMTIAATLALEYERQRSGGGGADGK